MNLFLLKKEVQNFINENLQSDLSKILLKKNSFENVTQKEIVQQIEGKIKAKTKIPTWYHKEGIFFPEKISLEQASSEKTAEYKSVILPYETLLDATGGLGIDTFFFSKQGKKIIYCEKNSYLCDITKYNFQTFGIENCSFYSGDFLDFLTENNLFFDVIYLDPARRNTEKKKIFLLEDCSPNVKKIIDILWKFTDTLLIKLSPILDIQATLKDLKNTAEIHCVSVQNEVKELLFIAKKNKKEDEKVKFYSVNILTNKTEISCFSEREEKYAYGDLKKYLYEPNASLMKLGFFNEISSFFNVEKIAKHSHLYTSEVLAADFQGRIFQIEQVKSFSKEVQKELKNTKANVTTRNFPISAMEIRKKYGIKEGNEHFLFFTKDKNEEKIVIFCKKIK